MPLFSANGTCPFQYRSNSKKGHPLIIGVSNYDPVHALPMFDKRALIPSTWLKGIPGVAFTWSSPVKLTSKADAEGNVILDEKGLPVINLPEGLKGEYLAWSSPESWLKLDTRLEPDFGPAGDGFGAPADAALRSYLGGQPRRTFKSHFAERPSPMVALDADNPDSQR